MYNSSTDRAFDSQCKGSGLDKTCIGHLNPCEVSTSEGYETDL